MSWPFDNFPEDTSTWEVCKTKYEKLQAKLAVAVEALEKIECNDNVVEVEEIVVEALAAIKDGG